MTARSNPALEAILEDFLTRREDNQWPTPKDYIARHPEFAKELEQFFNDLEFVDTRLADERGSLYDRPLDGLSGDGQEPATGSPVRLPAIGRFKVLEELGSGSQGVVYKAEQLGTKRIVALKVIREGAFASTMERRRFENEIQLASQLKHPNIVAIFECGQDRGRDYFAMEYVEGIPLDAYLSTHTLAVDETIRLLLQVCDGVSYAHQRGVIHRDLKPTNVIVDSQGKAHILDFGLAKRIKDEASVPEARITQVGSFAGTWHYASPEQVGGNAELLDVRSDVYALGVILYEALTDTYPYPIDGVTKAEIVDHILQTAPVRPSAIRADIDDDLSTIVLHSLQKDPIRRYQSAAAFGEDLRRYLAGEAIDAKRDSRWYLLRMTLRRYRWQAAAAGLAAAVLAVFAVTITVLYAKATAARATTEVRSQLVRSSQQYVVAKLDELNRLSNAVGEVREAFPAHPALQRLQKPLQPPPSQLLHESVASIPDDIDRAMRLVGTTAYAEGEAWLVARGRQLDEMAAAAILYRFDFGYKEEALHPDWLMYSFPINVGEAEILCKALVARALLDFHAKRDGPAVGSLTAARSIALDLGDGRSIFHKDASIVTRKQTYEALLLILESTAGRDGRAEPYIAWLGSDPPPPSYKEVVVAERLKLSQLFEGALRAGEWGGPEYIDLNALDAHLPGFAHSIWKSPGGHDLSSLDVTLDDVTEFIEAFAHEVESWAELPIHEVASRDAALRSSLAARNATRALMPLLPRLAPALTIRARVAAMRHATLLAAHLCRYRLDHGVWPARLVDAVPPEASYALLDPYTRVEFGYEIGDGSPVLYSLNDDGTDDEGLPGAWGQPGTDVVFFAPTTP